MQPDIEPEPDRGLRRSDGGGTLLALKSKGLVRFVHAGAGARTTRYGHKADERWRLDPLEQAALAVLLLRGPQTTAEVRTRAERLCPDETGDVEAALDTLTARTPNPFPVRLAHVPGEPRDPLGPGARRRWPGDRRRHAALRGSDRPRGPRGLVVPRSSTTSSEAVVGLATRVTAVEERLRTRWTAMRSRPPTSASRASIVTSRHRLDSVGPDRDRGPPRRPSRRSLARIESLLADLL